MLLLLLLLLLLLSPLSNSMQVPSFTSTSDMERAMSKAGSGERERYSRANWTRILRLNLDVSD